MAIRVVVLFGGKSGEHEVSLASARSVVGALRESGRYEVVPVGMTREGAWISSGDPLRELEDRARERVGAGAGAASGSKLPPDLLTAADVIFPVLHGPFGEDGTVQGMLELVGVPYVGSGVLASAAAMDKITMKKIFAHHDLPQVEWLGMTRDEWREEPESRTRETENALGYPCFVKPSNLGSSVGISKAADAAGLRAALDEAFSLDRRVIVERGVDARELEVSVLGNEKPEASVPGEILVTGGEFYDYEAKYTEGGMRLEAPAKVPEETAAELGRIASAAYTAIDAAGMSRVDFFLEKRTNRLLLNEINTIPGFTPTSVYPKLWAASGLPYGGLLDRLVDLALERHGAGS